MSKETSRWRECIAYTGSKFGMAVGRMFVEQHFDRKAKAHVSKTLFIVIATDISVLKYSPKPLKSNNVSSTCKT